MPSWLLVLLQQLLAAIKKILFRKTMNQLFQKKQLLAEGFQTQQTPSLLTIPTFTLRVDRLPYCSKEEQMLRLTAKGKYWLEPL